MFGSRRRRALRIAASIPLALLVGFALVVGVALRQRSGSTGWPQSQVVQIDRWYPRKARTANNKQAVKKTASIPALLAISPQSGDEVSASRPASTAQLTGLKPEAVCIQLGIRSFCMKVTERNDRNCISAISVSSRRASNASPLERAPNEA